MLAFDRLVESYRAKLRGVMTVLRGEDELPEPAQAPAAPTPQATTTPLEPAF